MKPIKLKIKGLNSFIEEQVIDFEKLTDRGLFGIFGPTGSGKSTVLDGITLALYGEVARKSSNFINTNCNSMNVSFEFQISGANAKRYVVEREFKRDNKTGNPRSAGCKIVDITSGELDIIAEGVKPVTTKCREILGLSLDDFTRTVVLPQGKFSEFLKLEGKERREMLERLFNLQKYGDNLSRKLNAEISREKTENSVLLGELKGYEDISENKLKEKQDELTLAENKLEELKKDLDRLEKTYKESEELWNLQLDLEAHKVQEGKLKEQATEIEYSKTKIRLGESALKVTPYIMAYENTLREIENTKEELNILKLKLDQLKLSKDDAEKQLLLARQRKDKELPTLKVKAERVQDAIKEKEALDKLEKEIIDITERYQGLRGRYSEGSKRLKDVEEKIVSLNSLISQLEEKSEVLKVDEDLKKKVQQGIRLSDNHKNIVKNVESAKLKIIKSENDIKKANEEEKRLSEQLKEKNALLNENKIKLDDLVKNCPGEQKDLTELHKLLLESREKWNKFNQCSKEITDGNALIISLKDQIEDKKKEKETLESLVHELKQKHKELEVENLAHVLRKELKQGDICPVCGSIEHHKENIKLVEATNLDELDKELKTKEILLRNVEQELTRLETRLLGEEDKVKVKQSEIELLGSDFKNTSVEQLEERVNNLEKALDEYEKNKESLDKSLKFLTEEKYSLENKLSKVNAVIDENSKQLIVVKGEYDSGVANLEVASTSLNNVKLEIGIEDFEKKNDEILKAESEREKLSKEVRKFRLDVEKFNTLRDNIQTELAQIKEDGTREKTTLEEKSKQKGEKDQAIKDKVGEETDLFSLQKKVKDEIEVIEFNFNKAEENKDRIDKEYQQCSDNVNKLSGKEKTLQESHIANKEKLEDSLKEEHFQSVDNVKASTITKEQINSLREEIEKYTDNVSKISGAIESINKKINGRSITEEQWSQCISSKQTKEAEIKEQTEVKINLQSNVRLIQTKLEEHKELLKKKEALDYKLALLDDLDKLFKGKKFVEYVATTQLKYVSIEASKKLKEITNGNYGLEVDENGKFIIRDYKNGGAERDASTLSGGETFLASLALALALSAQIQLKGTAPLELFFLDEGFGTLDDNLLEVVMSSLEKIHNDKLKVGIISHVESIKNRVPVKLMITPAESGKGGSKVKIERS